MASTGKVFPRSPQHAVHTGPRYSVTRTRQNVLPMTALTASYAQASSIMCGTAPAVAHTQWGASASAPVVQTMQGISSASTPSWVAPLQGAATTTTTYHVQTPITPRYSAVSTSTLMPNISDMRGASVELGYSPATRFPATASYSRGLSPMGGVNSDRVLDQRPITREELAATGNLVEEAPRFGPLPSGQKYVGSSVSIEPVRYAGSSVRTEPVRYAGRSVTVKPVLYAGSSVSIEPLWCAGSSITVEPVRYVGSSVSIAPAPALSHVSAMTVQAPVTSYVPAVTSSCAPAIERASPIGVSRTVVSYNAAGIVTPSTPITISRGSMKTSEPIRRSLFDEIDRNHDGVITRTEFNEAMRVHRTGRSVSPVAIF